MNPEKIHEIFIRATTAHQNSNLDEAEKLYKQVLEYQQHPDALHLLGLILSQKGNHEEAIKMINKAISLIPNNPVFYNNLGQIYNNLNQNDEAIKYFQKVLSLAPNFTEAKFNLGNVIKKKGDNKSAFELYNQVVQENPNHFNAFYNMGNLFREIGDYNTSIKCYENTIRIKPDYAQAYNNMGVSYEDIANNEYNEETKNSLIQKAKECYQKALTILPEFESSKLNLSKILAREGKNIDFNKLATSQEISPENLNIYLDLGKELMNRGDNKSAIPYFEKVIKINPNDDDSFNNLGFLNVNLENYKNAERYFEKAIDLNPDSLIYKKNLVKVYEKTQEIEKAKILYSEILKYDKDNKLLELFSKILDKEIYLSNKEILDYQGDLKKTIKEFENVELNIDLTNLHKSELRIPFSLIYQGGDTKEIREKFANLFEKNNVFPNMIKQTINNEKPHIGFVVTHNHEGIFTTCMKGILNNISTQEFEITVICNIDNWNSIVKPSLKNQEINFLHLPERIDMAIEKIMYKNFDILYYWEIGTDSLNYFLPFCRLAPIQCTSWGWPVTSGIKNIDYYISSKLLQPEENEKYYTEKLVRLDSLPAYYYKIPTPIEFENREYYGFNEKQNIYMCTQNLRKIHPEFDEITSKILEKDLNAVYVLFEDKNPYITDKLKERLKITHKENYNRIIFFDRKMSGPQYINLVKIADVMLDTPHFCGVNTTYDAYVTGTPVITHKGELNQQRYTYATYELMEIYDCIANSFDEYIKIAVEIANNKEYRNLISKKILEKSPKLFENTDSVRTLSEFFTNVVNFKNNQ